MIGVADAPAVGLDAASSAAVLARPSEWRRVRRVPWLAIGTIAVFVLIALLAGVLSPGDPYAQSLRQRLRPPVWMEGGTWANPLGTDRLGRDLLSRILHGARVSLAVGATAVTVAGAVGAAVGLLAGYRGGRIGAALMRVTDATLAFPIILLALVLAVTLGPSFGNVVLAVALILWARYARVLHGEVIALMEREFIVQARAIGCSGWRIMAHHLFPNTTNTLIVLLSLQVGYVIVVEAALSFLGAGIPPPTPAWGSMIAEGREYVTTAWWVSFFPGLAILLVVLAFNRVGDWLRDVLDPRLKV